MKKLENIDEFIAKSQYSILVKQFGLSYVLDKWKTACENMPYRKKYLVYEYLNDLCTRDVLDEIFTHCAVSDEHQKILADCDELFRKKTVIVKKPLYKEDDKDPIGHWYLYRIPKERILDWYPEGLEILQ